MHSQNTLKKWAVIDIETSGIHPFESSIIDVGYYQFEGTKLIKTYSSLVRFPGESGEEHLSHFIQKLTGINEKDLLKAPVWDVVEEEILTLKGHTLLAHNAKFEDSFLRPSFEAYEEDEMPEFVDSLLFLSLMYPSSTGLSLESFITDLLIGEKEEHRGLADSLDLLKVLLVAVYEHKKNPRLEDQINSLFSKYSVEEEYWFVNFFRLKEEELLEISQAINFDLEAHYQKLCEHRLQLKNTYSKESVNGPFYDYHFSGENVKSILREEDKIKERLPFYKYRVGQEDMALRVGQSFKNEVHALVQAPTGTGKTLGYLLPSTLFSLSEEKQILIATGTKTLQNQAMNKDVAHLRNILGLKEGDLRVKRLIGSNNHLCELLFRKKVEENPDLPLFTSIEKKFPFLYFERLFLYNASEKNPHTREEIPYVLKKSIEDFSELEREIGVDFRACAGKNCPYKGECSYINDIKDARDAHIIIGNHSLMFTWPKGLPRPAYIVADEAHKLEQEATSAFGLSLSQIPLLSFFKGLKNMSGIGPLFYLLAQDEKSPGESTPIINNIRDKVMYYSDNLQNISAELIPKIENYFKRMPRYSGFYWNEAPFDKKKSNSSPLLNGIMLELEKMFLSFKDLVDLFLPYKGRWDNQQIREENHVVALGRFEAFLGNVFEYYDALEFLLNPKDDYTNAMKYHEDFGFSFESSPIDVGRIIHDQLLETSRSVVFTSATLANVSGDQGGRSMEWASGYLYLDSKKRFKTGMFLPPVYDYQNKAKVFLCDDTPSLYDDLFVEKTLSDLVPLITDLKGKTLFLFSAKNRFEKAREFLLSHFEGKLPLFIQGMGNKVVEEFQKSDGGILLGMESFGEGIDVPGDALKFIFIDKIPDIRQDLIINDRRDFFQRNFGNEFNDYFLATRSRALHQKLGRLLRTEKDTGVVIIADSRIKKWKGRTTQTFFDQMKPYDMNRFPLKDAVMKAREFLFI